MTGYGGIRDLVLGFFEAIGADVSENDGAYCVRIPDGYRAAFGAGSLEISFDTGHSQSGSGHELMAPGSKTLSTIVEICARKGPVASGRPAAGRPVIRYHFFVAFSGRSSTSVLDYVDVKFGAGGAGKGLEGGTRRPAGWPDTGEVTSTYTEAIRILKERHAGAAESFLKGAARALDEDVGASAAKYDRRMRELDEEIHEREGGTMSPERIRDLRFQLAGRVEELDAEKTRLFESLQQKHRVALAYRLVGCEVLPIDPM